MTYPLEFITPCFCAGADQAHAEVRAPALRGELRWWFRCLGGSKQEEAALFGAAAGGGSASMVQLRVANFVRAENNYIPNPQFISPNDPGNYLHYLLTAPNSRGQTRMWETPPDPPAKTKGKIRPSSQIPPGSRFDMHLRFVRGFPSSDLRTRFELAVKCMLQFGSIGYRKTRGFGAWKPNTFLLRSEMESLLNEMKSKEFSWRICEGANEDPLRVLNQVETKLKGNKETKTGLRLEHPAKKRTPLGYSDNALGRQTSAVYFRPVGFLTKNGSLQFALLLLQAPDSVLGPDVLSEYKGRTRIDLK